MSTESAQGSQPAKKAPAQLDRDALVAGLTRYLDTILRAGRFNLRYEIQVQESAGTGGESAKTEIVAQLDGPDRDLLLERGAELLQALEHVAVRWLRLDRELHDRVRLDCGTYHADRLAELKLSAQVAATRVRETNAAFRFNPMTAADRRIIHLALQAEAGVTTASEGVGEQRRVVVLPTGAK